MNNLAAQAKGVQSTKAGEPIEFQIILTNVRRPVKIINLKPSTHCGYSLALYIKSSTLLQYSCTMPLSLWIPVKLIISSNTLLTFIELYKTLASYDAVSIRRHSTASCNCSSSKTGLTASSRTYWTQQIQDSITQNRLASLRRSVGHNEYEGSIEESSVGNKKTTKQ